MANYSLNQKLCRIEWAKGIPFVKWGTITKVTTQSYYVDGDKRRSTGWHASVKDAFREEYLSLFRDWDVLFGDRRRADDWTVEDTVRCTVRLRRLERRLLLRKSKATA